MVRESAYESPGRCASRPTRSTQGPHPCPRASLPRAWPVPRRRLSRPHQPLTASPEGALMRRVAIVPRWAGRPSPDWYPGSRRAPALEPPPSTRSRFRRCPTRRRRIRNLGPALAMAGRHRSICRDRPVGHSVGLQTIGLRLRSSPGSECRGRAVVAPLFWLDEDEGTKRALLGRRVREGLRGEPRVGSWPSCGR